MVLSSLRAWHRLVAATRESTPKLVLFASACILIPWVAGDMVMNSTNNEYQETELEQKLRARGGLDSQVCVAWGSGGSAWRVGLCPAPSSIIPLITHSLVCL